jgi:arylsulfatase A
MSNAINRREFIGRMGAAAAPFAFMPMFSCGPKPNEKLNFVFILIDDLGWTDLGCYGSETYDTPNIDRLASQGMKFTDAYAACPVCSPTRASIMTGKYPARLHLTDWSPGYHYPETKLHRPEFHQHLPLGEVTIAEMFKTAGYATASIGKWHLGAEDHYPTDQGFDINVAGYETGGPPSYFYPYERPKSKTNPRIPTMTGGFEGEYLTDRLTDEAETFIETNKDAPFFLYLSHFSVHVPLQAKEEYIKKYEASIKPGAHQDNPVYAAMVQSTDESVGRVMDKLDDLELTDKTVVIFMSDNGGLVGTTGKWQYATSNLPLRNGKGTAYEGGIREPMIVRWPGTVEPGSVCDVPVTSVDFYPTMLEIAGIPMPPEPAIDGTSITPLLKDEGTVDRDALYWHYPHYHRLGAKPFGAVRFKDHKLIEYYEDSALELYNLAEDIGEQHDLSGEMPEKTAQLRDMLHNWLKSVDAQMPTVNPEYKEG